MYFMKLQVIDQNFLSFNWITGFFDYQYICIKAINALDILQMLRGCRFLKMLGMPNHTQIRESSNDVFLFPVKSLQSLNIVMSVYYWQNEPVSQRKHMEWCKILKSKFLFTGWN